MRYVELPAAPRPLPFYLAAEEWLAANGHAGDEYFFMWQVNPTVICGRNQVIDMEVDLSYCRRHGIDVCRRRSGGGAVVADMNNIMFSYVSLRGTGADVATTFSRYTGAVARFLQSLGLDAGATGRNDILVDGMKVSGYAFYHLPAASIVHGTMLWDMDADMMRHALTPSRAKLQSSGVKSVPSRVTTLRPRLPHISITGFKRLARQSMCGESTLTLSSQAVHEIETIYMPPYLESSWIGRVSNRNKPRRRIDGVGEFVVDISAPGGVIEHINLSGDFFLLGDLDSALLNRLIGVERRRDAISDALAGTDVSRVIHNLSTDQFIELITQ